jgi:hypothetical protein
MGRSRLATALAAMGLTLTAVGGCSSKDDHNRASDARRSTVSSPVIPPAHGITTSGAQPASKDRVIELDGSHLTIADIVAIAHARATVKITEDGMARIAAARRVVDHYIDAKLPAYGITTMYGADFKTTLAPAQVKRFGRINLIQEATHVGDGSLPIVDTRTMRAAWALLANSYAAASSGRARHWPGRSSTA